MTGPVIPTDQWPEWADRHCWDKNGCGEFYGVLADTSAWIPVYEYSDIPMPAGHDWRVPVMRPSEQAPAYTYASEQATTCAGCGKHKHTPLRIDAMGGYVCLTCIDQKLGSLLDEFGYPEPALAIVAEVADEQAPAADPDEYMLDGVREPADRLPARIDGRVLVPVEPTEAMQRAATDELVGGCCSMCSRWECSMCDARRVYAAMIAAAPEVKL